MALEGKYATLEEMTDALARPLAKVQNALTKTETVRRLPELVGLAAARAHKRCDGVDDDTLKVYTGIGTFDRLASGIEPHELVIVAARPSIGKSSLARQIAWNSVKAGLRVAVFLLETSSLSFVEACAAQDAKVSIKGIRDEMTNKQGAYSDALKRMLTVDNLKLYDHDMAMLQIESRCRLLKQAWRPQLVVVDYLQIIRGRRDDVSTADAIGDLTMRFVALVKDLGCPIILMSQLNRSQERESNRQPIMSDLRDSGSIEADAHRIIFIHRPTMDLDGMNQLAEPTRSYYDCQLIQAKLRDGPKCAVDVRFQTRWATFEEVIQKV
jgi:replicative DNA helicase